MESGDQHMPRPLRRWGIRLLVVVLLLATFYVVAPLLSALDTREPKSRLTAPRARIADEIQTADAVRSHIVDVFVVAWCFAVGASFGSFVNVVAYRLPRGRTLLGNSRCPNCNMPIPLTHNVPVVSWFSLNGRCGTCRLPISPRYVLAEIVVGTLFVALLLIEVCSNGGNLPGPLRGGRTGLMWTLLTPQWELIRIAIYHATLLTLLFTIALIQFDRQRVPARLVWFGILVGVAAGSVWPDLYPVAALDEVQVTSAESWFAKQGRQWTPAGIFTVAAGLVAGAAIGLLMNAASRIAGRRRDTSSGWVGGMSLAGLFLGWQAGLVTAVAAAGIMLLDAIVRTVTACGRPLAPAASLLIAALAVIATWRWIVELIPLRAGTGAVTSFVALVTVAIAVALAQRFGNRDSPACCRSMVDP